MRKRRYTPNTKMADLLVDHPNAPLLIFRFDIPMGMGEKTIQQVCDEHGVHVPTFLAIVHYVIHGTRPELDDLADVDLVLRQTITFLRNSHTYFLDDCLPAIRRELVDVVADAPEQISFVITKYFEEYYSEVRAHMMYENEKVFPYVEKLLRGDCSASFNIETYEKHHDQIDLKALELKNIFIKYYQTPATYAMLHLLHELSSCAVELREHNSIEDYIFTPLVRRLEETLRREDHPCGE